MNTIIKLVLFIRYKKTRKMRDNVEKYIHEVIINRSNGLKICIE